MRKIITTFCFLLIGLMLIAQTNVTRIEGVVLQAGRAAIPIDFASVVLLPSGINTLTNTKGEFFFDKVDAGRTSMKIAFMGMVTIDTTVVIRQGEVNRFTFRMLEENLRLEDVTVTATRNLAGQATSSFISRQALDHIQATTIADALQLMPGVRTSSTGLGTPDFLTIRGSGGFATGLVIDGASLSANTNMMAPVNPSYSYNTTNYTTSGIDTRPFSIDDVESIEVIRGIAPVEHGDATSGTVIVKTKRGKSPFQTNLTFKPELYQGSTGKGFALGKTNILNVSLNYARQIKDATEAFDTYQRYIGKAGWVKSFGTSKIQTTFELSYQSDDRRSNPYDPFSDRVEKGSAIGYMLNHNGTLNINKGWLKSIEYVAFARHLDKKEFYKWRLTAASSIYSTATTNGAIVSNIPGLRVYDIDGNEITRIDGEENAYVSFLPDTYTSEFNDYSKEFQLYGKVKMNFFKQWNRASNGILIGGEYNMGGDFGEGTVYDIQLPPWRPSGFRPRAYKDVPYLHTSSAFLEDRFQFLFGKQAITITAGLRYDNFSGKTALKPRIHFAFNPIPWVQLKANWGLLTKAPAQVHLFPDMDYRDYRLTPNVDPSELILIQTLVYDQSNPNLELNLVEAKELGIDISLGKKRYLSVLYYERESKNGYSTSTTIEDTYQVVHQQWVRNNDGEFVPNHFMSWAQIYRASNNSYSLRRGVEYELNLGEIKPIRTELYVSGDFYRTLSKTLGPTFTAGSTTSLERHIGIRDESPSSSHATNGTTTIRLINHIPKIGFVITLASEIRWGSRSWTAYNNDWETLRVDMIDRYISYKDGQVYPFDPALVNDPEFSYLMPKIAETTTRGLVSKVPTTLFFNLRVSKTVGQNLVATFSANNVLDSRYRYESSTSPGTINTVGSNIDFSFSLRVTLK